MHLIKLFNIKKVLFYFFLINCLIKFTKLQLIDDEEDDSNEEETQEEKAERKSITEDSNLSVVS